jgi:hypothetical protein
MKHKLHKAIEHGVKAALAHMGHKMEDESMEDPAEEATESPAEEQMEGAQEGQIAMPMKSQMPSAKDHPAPGNYHGKGMMADGDKEAKKKFAAMSLKKKFNL